MRSYATRNPNTTPCNVAPQPVLYEREKTESARKGHVEMEANLRLLRDTDAAKLLGVSRSFYWKLVRRGTIPRPVRITNKMSRWRQIDIQKYLDDPRLLGGE